MVIKVTPVYLSIEKKLRQDIETGRLKIGSRLLPEPQLATKFKTSRETLRKALDLLTADGYLLRVPGRGTFVTHPADTTSSDFRRKLYHLRRLNQAIGVLVPSVTVSVYAGIIRGVEDYCRRHGYHVILGNYDGQPKKEKAYLEMFAERRVAGVVACPGYNSKSYPYRQLLLGKKIPFVLASAPVAGLKADVVKTDNISAARQATTALIQKSCKKIVFLCQHLSSPNSAERLTGYREALLEYNLPVKKRYILEKSSPGYKEKLYHLTHNGADGFVSANESTTLDLVAALNSQPAGKKWPRIMAFDRPSLLAPGKYIITFLHQPAHQIGWEAAEILLRRLREKNKTEKAQGRTVILPVRKERFHFTRFFSGM